MNKLPINSADDAIKIGSMIARSGMFGVESDEAGSVIGLMCHQQDMSLLEFQRTYHVVDGKPTMKADVMLSKFIELGGSYEIMERSAKRAAIKLTRGDGKTYEFAITIEEVREAGYCYKKDGKTLRDNWRIRPTNMLWARVVSDSVRTFDPRVNAGFYTQEEVDEIEKADSQPRTSEPTPKSLPAKEDTPKPFVAVEQKHRSVPFGKHQGKDWMDLPLEELKKMRTNAPANIEPGYIAAMDEALDKLPF